MNFVIIGEAAAKIMREYSAFTQAHAEIPWHGMRGMRNRMAHGYFDIDLNVVWNGTQTALPDLLRQLPKARDAAISWHIQGAN